MTILTGAFRDIAGKMAQGTVTLVSQVTRPAHSSAGQVVTEERHVIRLVDGAFVSPELDPGPIRVELSVSGAGDNFEVFEISLPEDGRHDLADLIDLTVDWSPGVIGRVEAAAADANRAAQAAGLSATRAADAEHRVSLVVASAADVVRGELQVQIDGAMQARVDAQAAQAAAEAAALTVVDDARTQVAALVEELEVSFSDAQELVATASGHAEASAGHAESAAGSAAAARESADAADAAAAVVGGAVEGAEKSAQAAATSATTAAGHAATAQQAVGEVQQAGQAALTGLQDHVTTAEGHATAAGVARTGAETARDEAVAAAESATTGVPVGGWQRSALHQDVQDSLSRADTAMQSMPRATGLAPGGVTLAGDLGGTADAPTVPGLAGKADAADVAALVKRLALLGTMINPLVLDASNPAQGQVRAELDRRGLDYKTVETIPFSIDARNAQDGSLGRSFENFAKLRESPLLLNTTKVTSMVSMFSGCTALTTVPAMDTSNVTSMGYVFSGCSALTTVPAMDTFNVTSMGNMFFRCSSLKSVTLPGMGNGFTTRQTLGMRDTKLDAAAANALMQSLGTVPADAEGSTLQLPATAAGADTSIATAKNWTVTVG